MIEVLHEETSAQFDLGVEGATAFIQTNNFIGSAMLRLNDFPRRFVLRNSGRPAKVDVRLILGRDVCSQIGLELRDKSRIAGAGAGVPLPTSETSSLPFGISNSHPFFRAKTFEGTDLRVVYSLAPRQDPVFIQIENAPEE